MHVAFVTYTMYFYMILNFGKPAIVEQPVWLVIQTSLHRKIVDTMSAGR